MRESAVRNSPLPPSIEKAYHQKCIDLKRRLREIEEANEAAALRKARLDRSITKMRIMRAFLLEQLVRSQDYDDAESEKSESAPPTPREPPPRLRRTNHRRSPGPVNGHQHASMSSPPGSGPPTYAMPANYPYAQITGTPQLDTPSLAPRTASSVHPPPHTNDMRSPSNSASGYPAELPLIQSLPNGTSVMLIRPGEPKRAPWTIRDLGPQHHVKNDFDSWPVELQEQEMFNGAEGPYLPYDMYGNAVQIVWDERLGKYKHVFIHDRAWVNPVANGVRMDGPEHGRQPMVLGRERERVGRERVGDRDRDRERDRERERERDRDRDRDRDREMRDVGSAAPAGDGRLTPELSSGPGSATTRDARNGAGGAAGAGGSTPSGAAGGSAAGGFTAANR